MNAVITSMPDIKPKRPSRYSFAYGTERIEFETAERSSRVQRVLIKVHPDCRVVAHAPRDSSEADVLNAVKRRSRWISQKLQEFRAQNEHITPRQYISGECHFYLGKRYQLKVLHASQEKEHIRFFRGTLEAWVQERRPDRVQVLLEEWYRERAKEMLAARLDAMLEQALWVGERPSLSIRTMKTRWGSCSPTGRLTLNPLLVKAPRVCIDYVILHELCHIAEHNHGPSFYRLMTQVMPDWEAVKRRLDNLAGAILNV